MGIFHRHLTTLFTLGPMAWNHEITALRAAGWSLGRITWPILAAGIGAAAVSAVLGAPGFGATRQPGSDGFLLTGGHARLDHALTCLVAVLVGVGLGVTRRAKTRFSGFLMAGAIFLGFHVLTAFFHALGRYGEFPPPLAGWAPLVLSAGLALVLFRRSDRIG